MGSSISTSTLVNQENIDNVLILGMGYAGKTRLLYKLKDIDIEAPMPTMGFNVEEVPHSITSSNNTGLNRRYRFYDVGGGDKIRPLFAHYHPLLRAVIFVIDSTEWFDEMVQEFNDTVLQYDYLKDICLLILCNKQDLPNSKSIIEIMDIMNLQSRMKKHQFKYWSIQPISAKTGQGLKESMIWLSELLLNNQDQIKPIDPKITENFRNQKYNNSSSSKTVNK
eukprot:gene8462-10393_t